MSEMNEEEWRKEKDAEIGRLVRRKMVSGNRIPVERCVIKAAEIADIEGAAPFKPEQGKG